MIRLIVASAIVVGLIGAFFLAAPMVDRRMNIVVPVPTAEPSSAAVRLHATLSVADMHGDLLLWPRGILDRGTSGHEDLPRMQEGRVALQVLSSVTQTPRGMNYVKNDSTTDQIQLLALVSHWPPATWRSRTERSLFHAAKLDRAVAASSGQLVAIRSSADLAALLAARANQPNRVGVLLSIEGLHAAEGTVQNLDRLYEAGFRMMGITHFFDNDLGGSSAGVARGGLTAFGREAVHWMEKRQVLVDLAHGSAATIDEVLRMATRPVVVSHTGVLGTCPGPRNLSDDQIRRVAATGGVIGIGFWEAAVCGLTPDTIAAAIRYTVGVAGIAHVGLGSDFDGSTTTGFDVSQMALVTDALLRRGFSDEEVRRIMGQNLLALLMSTLPPS